jgi:hypothetical protein
MLGEGSFRKKKKTESELDILNIVFSRYESFLEKKRKEKLSTVLSSKAGQHQK